MLDERPQHERALELAQERKREIDGLRASIHAASKRDGMLIVAGMLREPSPPVNVMKVYDLLRTVRWLQSRQIISILTDANIRSFDRRVRDLTERQRHVVAFSLVCAAEKVGK